ncbi:hypothetical protein UK23_29430 [Lentzea aerocolonigenes]|uniref:DUF397 domain-containing protein n=1 Tax=Lentzea aerocolonigenes TaxID=68170 RepID=A0A0F0GM87_LENAE|nr:DUF397 domain-containing protein [Lentzea aerocolonigenes]KJK44425.1 hypothetical protein UK23_29430 [Lentzea aerocolonigenes]
MIPDLSTATWRKASRSGGNGGQCVELALVGDRTFTRDSKNVGGAVLSFSNGAWGLFLDAAKDDRLDG